MSITLSYGAVTIDLHPDLLWSDEHSWSPITQAAERSITGAMLIEYGTKIAGRNITLQAEDTDSGWISRTVLEQLKVAASVAGREMTLSINGTPYSVVFRHLDGPLEATPVIHYNDADPNDWFTVTLRFLEI